VKVVYAYPADQSSRFVRYADLIQHVARDITERFRRETAGEKLLRFDIGTSCGPNWADIQSVRPPRSKRRERNAVRRRVLYPAVERANALLAKRELPTISPDVTFHSLRRTYASLAAEAGVDPA
jgi:hypothetical protein